MHCVRNAVTGGGTFRLNCSCQSVTTAIGRVSPSSGHLLLTCPGLAVHITLLWLQLLTIYLDIDEPLLG